MVSPVRKSGKAALHENGASPFLHGIQLRGGRGYLSHADTAGHSVGSPWNPVGEHDLLQRRASVMIAAVLALAIGCGTYRSAAVMLTEIAGFPWNADLLRPSWILRRDHRNDIGHNACGPHPAGSTPHWPHEECPSLTLGCRS